MIKELIGNVSTSKQYNYCYDTVQTVGGYQHFLYTASIFRLDRDSMVLLNAGNHIPVYMVS
jgi:allophanate hydrolase subunit 1